RAKLKRKGVKGNRSYRDSRDSKTTQEKVFRPRLVTKQGMDITKEFEVAQEIYAERLSKQDEETAQKIEGTKKIKRKHTMKGWNEMESEQNKGDTQVEEMTSEVTEIKTNTDIEMDMTSPQSDIEVTEAKTTGVGTEDQQTSDLSLAENVQLMEMDLQWEQRLAERLEAELKKNAQEKVLKDKEVQKVSYSAKIRELLE
ncbi:5993_t:CDS:2, partial [Gigaspora margarita]